jgi:hypothetical protein
MILEELKKAEEIRQQIEVLEKIINHKTTPFEKLFIIKEAPKFRLAIKTNLSFGIENITVTSDIVSDAIKKALKQTIEDLKGQLVELGVEIKEVDNED